MPFPRLLPLITGLLMLLSGPAMAEKADRDLPMQIEADRMQHDEHQRHTTFIGRIQAVKGTLVLRAERLEVREEVRGQQQAQLWAAPGQRVFFRQKREGVNEYIEGEAEQVAFDNRQEVLTLSRRAEVRVIRGGQLADRLQGDRIIYNQTSEVFHVDGQLPGVDAQRQQRVRAVLVPRAPGPESARPELELKTDPSTNRQERQR